MISIQTLEKRKHNNTLFLYKYFKDFKDKNNLIQNYIHLIELKSFEFNNIIKTNNKIPINGATTKIYWFARGWSESEIELKREKKKLDPTKSPMNKQHWINKGLTEEEAIFKINSFRKLNKEYWLIRGFNEEEAKVKVAEFQNSNGLKFILKRKSNPELYDDINTNQLKYWINKGYNEEEAKVKLKERQTTFSLEKCIDKHGIEEGTKIWQTRQNKWQNNLINISNYNGTNGKSFNILNRIKKFTIDELVDSLTISNKNNFKIIIKKSSNIKSFIENYMYLYKDEDEITIYKILKPLRSSKLLHIYYNTDFNTIMSLIIPRITRICTRYSNISWFNGHICRSDNEYIIATFLFKNNIKYQYEKYYLDTKKKCDFYLTEHNLYVEYLGMKLESYKTKLEFLYNNKDKINYICFDNIKELKLKILEYVNNKNK